MMETKISINTWLFVSEHLPSMFVTAVAWDTATKTIDLTGLQTNVDAFSDLVENVLVVVLVARLTPNLKGRPTLVVRSAGQIPGENVFYDHRDRSTSTNVRDASQP